MGDKEKEPEITQRGQLQEVATALKEANRRKELGSQNGALRRWRRVSHVELVFRPLRKRPLKCCWCSEGSSESSPRGVEGIWKLEPSAIAGVIPQGSPFFPVLRIEPRGKLTDRGAE